MSRPAVRRCKGWLAARAAGLARRPPLTPAELRALRPRRLLIVRQHNQMGDMICATPALRSLRRAYPEAEIALVCAPVNHEVVRHNPDLDRTFVFAQRMWRRPDRLLRFLHGLRRFRPELAFVLNSVSFSVTSAWIAAASGARWIVGGDSRPFGWDVSGRLYSLELPSRPEPDRHAVLHNLAPLAAVGLAGEDLADLATVVVPAASEAARAAELLAALPDGGPLLALHPGAGKRANCWPAERFAAVAARAAAAGERVLVLQGPADGEPLARLRAALVELGAPLHDLAGMPPAPSAAAPRAGAGAAAAAATAAAAAARSPAAAPPLVLAPLCPVGVAAALLARADRFLCNDTGLMHVAGAVGTPTLALFGPTDPALWKPLAPQVRALRGEGGDLAALTVAAVWSALRGLPPRPQAGAP